MTIPNYAYFEGQIVPYSKAKVGVLTHALNYGTAAFGGLRGYWNPEGEQLYLVPPPGSFHEIIEFSQNAVHGI